MGNIAEKRLAGWQERLLRDRFNLFLDLSLHVGYYYLVSGVRWEVRRNILSRYRGLSRSGTTADRKREIECVHY